MTVSMRRWGAAWALCLLLTPVTWAQGAQDREAGGNEDLRARIAELLRRIEQERAAREQAEARNARRLEALEAELARLRRQQEEKEQEDELQRLLEMAETEGPPPMPKPQTTMSILNPNISVIPDFVARSLSIDIDGRPGRIHRAFPELFEDQNPFRQREVEIDMRAAVAPDADGVAILAVGDEEPAAFEEVYVVLRNLPWGLGAKIGKFLVNFGRANRIHQHDLPQTDRPLVHQLLFGPEGLSAPGVSLEKALHTSTATGSLEPAHVSWTVEAINSSAEEAPILGEGMDNEPAVNSRVGFFWQIDDEHDLEVGGSALASGRNRAGDGSSSLVGGIDVTWRRKRSRPGAYDGWLVQGELIGSRVETRRDGRVGAAGGYLTVQRQLDPQTYVGIRLDRAESPVVKDADIFGVAPYISYYLNEFLRLRLQYTFLRARAGDSDARSSGLSAQVTWVFGAHPPEPYWVNK